MFRSLGHGSDFLSFPQFQSCTYTEYLHLVLVTSFQIILTSSESRYSHIKMIFLSSLFRCCKSHLCARHSSKVASVFSEQKCPRFSQSSLFFHASQRLCWFCVRNACSWYEGWADWALICYNCFKNDHIMNMIIWHFLDRISESIICHAVLETQTERQMDGLYWFPKEEICVWMFISFHKHWVAPAQSVQCWNEQISSMLPGC